MLSLVMLVALGLALVACGGGSKRINAPDRLEEDIGTGMYIVPRYEVVDQNGMILAGYNVTLKSATDPNGEAAEISRGVSTIVTIAGPGEYTFVFTANAGDVKDATVIMDFADRKAPTVSMSSSLLPDFFIKGNAYSIPEYAMIGDYDVTKCFTKVFYIDEAGTESEVTVSGGQFEVDKSVGKYTILIHAEDAAGNFNEYRYTRRVDGPEQYDANTIVYFNEAFGARQVEADGDYAGRFVSKDEEGGKAYGNEAGSYKVNFKGVETENNEAYFNIRVPAIVNIMDYKELEMYVFIEDDGCEAGASEWVVGSKWWNDQRAKVGEWTRITWSVSNWGNGTGANVGSVNTNVISTDNIAGTRIRLIPDCDYSDKTPPHGAVYFSAMRAIPYDWSEIEAQDGVSVSATRVKYGETVTLTAEEKADQFFDCFIVDGKPISGDSFVAYKDSHTVSARYSDEAISKDNYSWGEYDFVAPGETPSGEIKAQKLGNADVWALSYDITATNQSNGNFYFGAYIGGTRQIAGVEFASWGKYLTLYGHVYSSNGAGGTVDERGHFSQEVQDAILNASAENPVTVTFVRDGADFALYVTEKGVTMLAARIDLTAFMAHAEYDNSFGYGWRSDFSNPTITNIKYVVGETRTGYAKDALDTITVTAKDGVTLDKTSYAFGDTVTLSHGEAPVGKEFAYYKVNGVRIEGNTFTVIKNRYEAEVVFNDLSVISVDEAFAGEIETADGKTQYVMESTVALKYTGTPESGKYFDCFLVDGNPINGDTFTATKTSHTVGVKFFTDFNDMTWGEEEFVAPEISISSWGKAHKLGSAEKWVLTYDMTATNAAAGGSWFMGAMVRGNQLNGYEMGSEEWQNKLGSAGDGEGSSWDSLGKLPAEVIAMLNGASEENPVNLVFVRDGAKLSAYVQSGDIVYAVVKAHTLDTLDEKYGFDFGYGWRTDAGAVPTIENIRFVTGEEKLAAFFESIKVEIRKEDSNIKLDKESYEIGDTVTLSATAPAGEAFSHFMLDGERLDGNTFVVTKLIHTVGVVFTRETSTLELPADVQMEGESNVVSRGATVTLSYKGTNPKFDGFAVDGTPIVGNTFKTTAGTHTVTVRYFTDASDMTWNEAEFIAPDAVSDDTKVHKLGNADQWVLSYDITETNQSDGKFYFGAYIGGTKQIAGIEFASWGKYLTLYGHVYSGNGAGGTVDERGHFSQEVQNALLGATEEAPVTVAFVRNGKDFTLYVIPSDDEYMIAAKLDLTAFMGHAEYNNNFGYGWRSDFPNPTITNIKFVTEENKLNAFVAAQTVTIQKAEGDTKVGTEKDGYVLGDTVTLTHAAAEQGFGFSHYTVDGVALAEGVSTFKAMKNSYTVGAVYVNLEQSYRLVVEEHNSFATLDAGGQYTLPVATLQDAEGGEVSGYTVTVSVEGYTVTENKITVSYRGAVALKITYSVEEIEGKEVEITVNVQPEDGTVFTVDENVASRVKANGTAATVAYNTDKKYGTEAGSLAITINEVLGYEDYAWLPTFDFGEFTYIETYVYVEKAGVKVGAHWYGDRNLAANQWTCVRLMLKNDNMNTNGWVLRIMNVEAGDTVYFSSSTLKKYDGGAIIDLSYGAGHGEWTSEKTYDGDDETVDTTGSLKVTATDGDFYSGFTANALGVMLPDITGYSKIYFYVYTDAENAADILAGTTWAGDTNLVTGQWTKVEIPTSKNIDTKTQMQEFRFRIQRGASETFYITSVYGVK